MHYTIRIKDAHVEIQSVITSLKPNSSTRMRRAKGPPAPCIPSNKIENCGCLENFRIASKSKLCCSTSTYSVNGSMIVTEEVEVIGKIVPTAASISISGDPSRDLNMDISRLRS